MPAIDEINGRIVYYRPPPPAPPPPTPAQKQAAADAKAKTDAAVQTANTAVNNYIQNGDDSTAAQATLDKPLSDVIGSVQNELRRQADEAPAGGEKKAIEDAAAAIKKRDPDAKWLDKIVDDAKDAVEKQDPSQRTASEARDGVLDAQDTLQDAQNIKVTNRTIAEDKQDSINTAQANLDKAIQDFKTAIGGELSTYEHFGSGDNLKAANDAADALAKAHPDWDDGSLAFARNIATADAIQYQVNHINPNDPTLSAQDKALATNDPVQFACVQLARPHANDENAEQIYEQIGAASYDVRVTYTKDQVAAKMQAGDAQGALKILSTNMNDVSVTSADPDARDHLYQMAGAPFFNAHSDYFNKQISDLTQVYKYDPEDPDSAKKMADSTVKYDAVGKWMKDLAKVAPPEVASNLLTTVEDRFNDNGHWFQSNSGDSSGLMPNGSDFYGGLSLTAAVADAPRFSSDQSSTDHAQQVANWLTTNADAKSFLYSMQTSGSGGSMPSWVPVQNAVGDGNGATVTNALIQQHGKDLPNADMLQRAFDRGNEKVQQKQAEADYKTFQSDQNAGLKNIFGQMSKATFGKDTPLYNDKAVPFTGPDAGTQLKNYIGGALMIQADNAGAQSSGTTGTAWFTSGNSTKVIDEVDQAIHKAGGDNPTVKAIPIAYVDKSAGVMPTALFEVADKNGGKPHYIDDRGWDYSSLNDYRHNNALSDGGTVYLPKNLAGTVALDSNGVPDVDHFSAHITTTGQQIRHVVDIVAGVATAVGGVILSVGTFGGASIVGGAMVAVGTGWIVGESVDHLNTLADHGRSWSPLNPEATNDWLAIVTSAAGEYSLAGKGLVAVSDVANASRLFKITRTASDLVAGGGGMIMTGAQVKDLLMYGDRMSGEQKAESIMFLGLGLGQVGATRMLERVGLSQGTERVGLLNALKNNADRYKPTEMAPEPTTVAANDPATAGRPTADPTTEPLITQAGGKTTEPGGTTPGSEGKDGTTGKPGSDPIDPIDPATRKPKTAGDPATEPGRTGTPGDEGTPTNTGPARPSRPLPGALDDLANPEVTLTSFTDTQKALDAGTQNALSQHADLLLDAENYRTDGTTNGRHPRGIGVRRLAAKLAAMSDEQRQRILSKAEFAHDTANIKDPVRISWRQRMQLYRGKSSVFGRTADRIMSPVDRIQAMFIDRGIRNFFVKGGTEDAAAALMGKRILMVTGFTVGRDPTTGRLLPETDGPVGTGEKAATLARAGYDITVATDSANMPVLKSVLDTYPGGHLVKLELFDAKRGQPARDAANELLDRVQPEAVVAIELPARNADGDYLNMRGISVADVNAPKDQIVLEANKRKGIITVGVGDGGNEAGMGSLRSKIPPVTLADGSTVDFASTVPVDFPVTAWNSNFGAQAILANMLRNMGRLDLMPKPEQLHAAIKASVDAGAVDGVSRKGEASVDGFASKVHQGMLVLLRDAMNHMPDGKTFDEATPNEPFTVAAFDSSNGGLIAAPGKTLDGITPPNPRMEPTPISNAVMAMFTPDMARIENPKGVDTAAAALQDSHRILVLAGARNAHGAVDTDGIAGAAVFGHDMQASGKQVVYVVPHEAVPALDAALQARGAAVNDYSIVPFDAAPGEQAHATAQDLINRESPDTIVSINVHGRNADGRYIDQNGNDVTDQTVPLDEVAATGWKTDGVTTIGVGSRGHEAGMGNTRRTARQVTLPDGTVVDPRSVVPADHYVSASNSNWGAHGLAASALKAAGRTDLLSTHQQHMDALEASVNAGAVDGVTGRAEATVGGHDSNTYQTVVQMINLAAGKKPDVPPPTAASATGPMGSMGPTGPEGPPPDNSAPGTQPTGSKTTEPTATAIKTSKAGDDGNGTPPTEPDPAPNAGEPRRKPWIRWIFAGSVTGAFSTAASSATLTGSAATHAVFDPSVTSPLSFIYRGSIAALRANKARAVSDQIGKLGTENSDSALAWLKTNMADHGRRWGVTKGDRQTIADAVAHFQDNPDALTAALSKIDDPKAKDDPDVQALLALKGAPGKLLSPKSPVGRANDTLQLLTLALNNGNTAYWFATHGAHLNTPSFWSNALFLSANLALSSRNFAGRLGATFNDKATNTSPWLNRAQAFTMSLYTVGSVPLAMNDALMHTNSPALGATKAALDLAFGAGALRIAGDLMPKVGQRLPSNAMLPGGVILGVAAVTRFGIELFVPNQAAKPAVAQLQANGNVNGNGQDQDNQPIAMIPLPDMQGVSGDVLRANAPHARPSIGTATSPQYAIVGPGDTLWQLSAADAAKLLGTTGPASNARTGAAFDKLPPMNSQFDWAALDGNPYTQGATGQDPDLVVPGDIVRIG